MYFRPFKGVIHLLISRGPPQVTIFSNRGERPEGMNRKTSCHAVWNIMKTYVSIIRMIRESPVCSVN